MRRYAVARRRARCRRPILILTNPPFGTKKGGGRPNAPISRSPPTHPTSSLPFVEHIVRALKPGGRAAMVVPDNVLFEDNSGRRLAHMADGALRPAHDPAAADGHFLCARRQDQRRCFSRAARPTRRTRRPSGFMICATNMPAFGKTRPLTVKDFAEFEKAYGNDPLGKAKRKDQGEEGRLRCFTRDEIKARNDNLDIAWLARHRGRGRGAFDRARGHRRRHHRPPEGRAWRRSKLLARSWNRTMLRKRSRKRRPWRD